MHEYGSPFDAWVLLFLQAATQSVSRQALNTDVTRLESVLVELMTNMNGRIEEQQRSLLRLAEDLKHVRSHSSAVADVRAAAARH